MKEFLESLGIESKIGPVDSRVIERLISGHNSYPGSQLIASIIARHSYHPSGSVMAHMPEGYDAMSWYIRNLQDPLADSFEARLLTFLEHRGVQVQFAMGANIGYWIIPSSSNAPGATFSVISARKNFGENLKPETDWILRFEEPLHGVHWEIIEAQFNENAAFVRQMKVRTLPEQPGGGAKVPGRRGQWNAKDLRSYSPLSRSIDEVIDLKSLRWRG